MKKLLLCAGARPNFMKIAALVRALESKEFKDVFDWTWLHTTQHSVGNMSTDFFEDLGLPWPDFAFDILDVERKNEATQLSSIIFGSSTWMDVYEPDIVVVVGDTTSTLGCALAANKLRIPVAHVEAGMRCFDMNMPEEVNRVLTDKISTWLFCSDPFAVTNLEDEQLGSDQLMFEVGDIMVDNLKYCLYTQKIPMPEKQYDIYLTLHRQSNVDVKENLQVILQAVNELSKQHTIVFPMHPRTKQRIAEFELWSLLENVAIKEPLSYYKSLVLWAGAKLIVTDSGGLQPETCFLTKPCLVLREETERLFTLRSNNPEFGTSFLIGDGLDVNYITDLANGIIKFSRNWIGKVVELPWQLDGNVAKRILKHLV